MAQAAQAAQAVLARNRALADKQLSSLQSSLKPLKDAGFHSFFKQLKTQAFAYGWPPHILDIKGTTPDLTATERADLDSDDPDDLMTILHMRNAYVAITEACTGHQVESLTESIPQGHAREVLDCIKDFHNPATTGGRRLAYNKFVNATMASTHTNIVEWIAEVRRNGQDLRQVGGHSDDDTELAMLLNGLLPEFSQIKLLLDETETMTMPEAVKRLTNYARNNGLLLLAKGRGAAPSGAKVFAADSVAEECRHWTQGKCYRGETCPFSHSGPGACLNPEASKAQWKERQERLFQERQKKRENKQQATTYTAHDAPAASYIATAVERVERVSREHDSYDVRPRPRREPGRAAPFEPTFEPNVHLEPQLCYICFSADHDTHDCTAYAHPAEPAQPRIFMAAADEAAAQPQTPSPQTLSFSMLFTFFTSLLVVIIACATSLFMGLRKIGALFEVPAVRTFLAVVLLAGVMTLAQATTIVAPHEVSATCYFNNGSPADTPNSWQWVVDTGSNRFATNDVKDFKPGSVRYINTRVLVGNGYVISPCEGTVMIKCHTNGKLIECTHTLLLPDCDKKLMPARPFLKKGCTITISEADGVTMLDPNGEPFMHGREIDGLYYYNVSTAHPLLPTSSKGEAEERFDASSSALFGLPLSGNISASGDDFVRKLTEAHQALGHMHFDKVRKLFGLKRGANPDCATCAISTQKKEHLSMHVYNRATQPNHRVHMDIAYTEGSENPFQLYVDDCSRVSHLDLLESKSDTLAKWEELKIALENRHFPHKVAFIKTDNEFVYTSNAWLEHCRAEGIEHEFSARYRHDMNGVVERAIGVVGNTFRCLMIQGGAPDSDIPNALVHSNVIRNNTPTSANNGMTPKEKEAGMKLGINARLLKGPLFCLCYAHIYEEERVKHGPRGVACVYLGYDDRNDQYKVKEWISGRIYYTGDAVFHPRVFPYRASPAISDQWIKEMDVLSPRVPVSANNPAPHAMPTGPRRSDRQHGYIYSGEIPLRDIPDVDHVPPDNSRALIVHSFGPDPDNWTEALASRFAQDWLLASLEEKASFQQHGVYKLVPRAEATGKKIYKPRPVFKIKINPPTSTNPEATVDKFKLRQTIAAYTKSMVPGIDFAEKRASTVRWEATLVQIAIAVMFDLEIALFDIKTFFLYGHLDDVVHMEQPPEWEDPRYPATDYVCRLLRSMYGLPQAPHCAQQKLKTTLLADKAFTQTAADDCVYVSGKPGNTVYAATGTHVDDLLAVATPAGLKKLSTTLKKEFEITEKLNPTMVTGVQIERNREAKWLKLHQCAYTETILEEFGQTQCSPVDTPMDPGTVDAFMQLPVATPADADPHVLKSYRKLVGMLIWLYKTRPDMLFTVNLLARHLHNATQAHFNIARGRPLRYLSGTKSHGLVFCPGELAEWKLSGSSDADLAGDRATSRSTIGFYSKMGDYGAVSYNCSLERKIATSTQQAETYALASMIKDTIWLRQLLHELGCTQQAPTRQLTDNRGVYLQSTKQVNHATAKHFRISQAFIRGATDDAIVDVDKVDTRDNGADFFTKALTKEPFYKHRLSNMGPQECPRSIK